MPLLLTPRGETQPLLARLQALGFQRQAITVMQGICLLLTIPIAWIVVVELLDRIIGLPVFVRAVALVIGCAGTLSIVRRYLFAPLRQANDPVALALLIESQQPEWNDSLASTVQFLEDDRRGSARLRQRTIQETLARVEDADFDAIIDRRRFHRAALWMLGVWLVATPIVLIAPTTSQTALRRFFDPYGGHGWTRIRFDEPAQFPSRMARGNGFELAFTISGRLPERVQVSLWPEGGTVSEQNVPLPSEENALLGPAIPMRVSYEPDRVAKSFRIRVRAGDFDSDWLNVAVLPPPILMPIDGHPSPRLRLELPAYTQRPIFDLPDGSAFLDCVPGSCIHVRAAVDRPIVQATVQNRSGASLPAIMAALAVDQPLAALGAYRLAASTWEPTSLGLSDDGQLIDGVFWPRLPGIYSLLFTDSTGLSGSRLLEVRVQPDPAPAVALDRPQGDALYFVPDAQVPFSLRVSDKVYAIRTVGIEYRTKPLESLRTLSLHDGSQRPERPTQWNWEDRLALTKFHHADGAPLQAGDTLILNGVATDFDDVSTFKAPGRSAEVTIRIVSPMALDATLQQAQVKARQDVEQLRDLQQRARQQVREVQEKLQRDGRLQPADLEKLFQAEQLQQQLRARLADPEQGLRSQIEQLRQTAKDNRLPSSPVLQRLEALANDLERLTEEELVPIEPLIAQARKELDRPENDPSRTTRNESLRKAETQQRRAEETLDAMLERLRPWDAANELRGNARDLLNETQRLGDEAREWNQRIPSGMRPQELTEEQRNVLDRLASRQDRLADEARQLADKLARLGADKQRTLDQQSAQLQKLDAALKQNEQAAQGVAPNSPQAWQLADERELLQGQRERLQESIAGLKSEVDALKQTIERSLAEGARRDLRQAADRLRQNQTGEAGNAQQQAAQQLQELLRTLDEPRGEEPDRLRKKTKQAQGKIDQLVERQEELQKRVENAENIADPAARAAELQRLAGEQERLEKLTREAARELGNADAEATAQALRRAERLMEDAREQLEQGRSPVETQDDALDQLDASKRQLGKDENRQQADLQREQQRRTLDEVRRLLDRQRAARGETERIHQEVSKAKKWSRPLLTSLDDLANRQSSLAEELRGWTEQHFEDDRVFQRLLQQSIEAMDLAAERMQERKQDGLDALQLGMIDVELERIAQERVMASQKTAIRRLEILLQALEPDAKQPDPMAPAPMPPMPPMDPPPMPPPMPMPMNANRPLPTAQLKALRELQADVNERTAAFAKAHPRIDELTESEEAELEKLRKEQDEVAELLKELLPSLERQGGTP